MLFALSLTLYTICAILHAHIDWVPEFIDLNSNGILDIKGGFFLNSVIMVLAKILAMMSLILMESTPWAQSF